MKRNLIILLVYLIGLLNNIIAQSIDDGKAHRRYWYYRARLINDFMKIGKDQGECIVFAERNDGYDGIADVYRSKVGPDQIDITNQYIIALCLEYKILSRNNQDTRETIKEIFHLLYAINRLDLEAEQFFSYPLPHNQVVQPNGLLNGFILREDMPFSYINVNKTHFNYELLENEGKKGGFTGIMHTNALSIDNKFSGYHIYGIGTETQEDLTCVQEKYMSMLVAMQFINKYIPDAEKYVSVNFSNGEPFQDGETGIKQEAKNIANRCYNYLKNKNSLWNLYYMDLNGDYLAPLSVGSGAYVYSWPLSRMACWANSAFPWNQNNPFQCPDYTDPMSQTTGRVTYNGFTVGTTPKFEDFAVMKAWCHAGSNLPSLNDFGTFQPIYLGMMPNTAVNSVEWAELLRKVLHQNGILMRQLSIYANPINQAPCQGPYNYGGCSSYGGFEWSSQDRLEHPKARGAGCENTRGPFLGNYPGVDYMLLHNLYYEYQNQLLDGNNGNVGGALSTGLANAGTVIYNAATQAGNVVAGWFNQGNSGAGNGGSGSDASVTGYMDAINYMDNRDENIWPRRVMTHAGFPPGVSFVVQGTDNNPGKVAMFQYLTSKAHIYSTASPAAPANNIPSNITYRAGKEITFEPGFTVDAGSTFHGYIARYLCNGDNSNAMNMRQANTTDSVYNYLYTNDYEGDNINPVPIHYIESPKSDSDLHPVVDEHDDSQLSNSMNTLTFNGNDFNIVPNPSSGMFKIQTKKVFDDETLSVKVYDMKGQLIYNKEDINSEHELNLDSYTKGIYLIQVYSSLGYSNNKKVELID